MRDATAASRKPNGISNLGVATGKDGEAVQDKPGWGKDVHSGAEPAVYT